MQNDAGTILVRGSRSIAKTLGVSSSTVLRRSKARLLPAVRLGRTLVMPAGAEVAYALALARELLARGRRREQPVAAMQQGPRGGGLVPASGADGPTPAPCKKVAPKQFEGPVVMLP